MKNEKRPERHRLLGLFVIDLCQFVQEVKMKLKNKRRTSLLVVGAALLLIAVVFVFGKYEFSLTEAEIQEKVSDVLPINKNGVSIDTVNINLPETGTVTNIEVSGSASRLGRTYSFTLQADGVPEYNFLKGSFYFRPSAVEIVSLEQTEGETVEGSVSRISTFARELFPQRSDVIDELEYAGIKVAPQIQKWLESKAELAAVYVLQRAPIYTLPSDAKGFMAKAVLDDVRIENDTLIVKLSLYRLGTWVLLFGLLALIAFGMMLSPWAMAGGLVLGSS